MDLWQQLAPRQWADCYVNAMASAHWLTRVRASKSRGGGPWSDDDYDVRESAGRAIDRIFLSNAAPTDRPWF